MSSIDSIERETIIAASIERVWTLVAQPGWWATDDEPDVVPVAAAGESTVVKHSEHGEFPVRVERVVPPTYVAYRWMSAFPGQALRDENSTLVECFLSAEGDKTRLRVVESGFATLPTSPENRQNVISDHTGGWPQCLDAVRARAEQPAK